MFLILGVKGLRSALESRNERLKLSYRSRSNKSQDPYLVYQVQKILTCSFLVKSDSLVSYHME